MINSKADVMLYLPALIATMTAWHDLLTSVTYKLLCTFVVPCKQMSACFALGVSAAVYLLLSRSAALSQKTGSLSVSIILICQKCCTNELGLPA